MSKPNETFTPVAPRRPRQVTANLLLVFVNVTPAYDLESHFLIDWLLVHHFYYIGINYIDSLAKVLICCLRLVFSNFSLLIKYSGSI